MILHRLEQDLFRQGYSSMCFQVLNLATYKSNYVLITKKKYILRTVICLFVRNGFYGALERAIQ